MRSLFELAVAIALAVSTHAETPGRIYVYAQRLTPARSWLPIACDGAVAAELKQGMLFAIDAPAGRHALSTEKGVPTSVDVHPGEEVFVRLDWNHELGRSPIPVLTVVPAEHARKETKYLVYIDSKKALSASVPKTDPRGSTQLKLKTRDNQ